MRFGLEWTSFFARVWNDGSRSIKREGAVVWYDMKNTMEDFSAVWTLVRQFRLHPCGQDLRKKEFRKDAPLVSLAPVESFAHTHTHLRPSLFQKVRAFSFVTCIFFRAIM